MPAGDLNCPNLSIIGREGGKVISVKQYVCRNKLNISWKKMIFQLYFRIPHLRSAKPGLLTRSVWLGYDDFQHFKAVFADNFEIMHFN